MANKAGGKKRARDAITGRFIPIAKATQNPDTTVKETIKQRPKKKRK